MTYDTQGLSITDTHVFFFKNVCPFSNFYESKFTYTVCHKLQKDIENYTFEFFCSEQYFMLMKALIFNDVETAIKIKEAKTAKECKELGRQVKNYDDDIWKQYRYGVMLQANYQKFQQNEELKKFILDERFDGKTFVEASPYDAIWGIEMSIDSDGIDDESNWKGENLQGKVIGEVRKMLLKSEGVEL